MTLRRRHLLPALAFWPAALTAAPAQRGETVAWPAALTLIDGTTWTPERAQGHAVVVVFWSLSCAYCERHNAHIEKLHQAAKGRPLLVLGAVQGANAAAVRRHMAARAWSFPVTVDAGPLAAALTARRSVPMTVTIDPQGRVRDAIPGEMFEADVMGMLQLAA